MSASTKHQARATGRSGARPSEAGRDKAQSLSSPDLVVSAILDGIAAGRYVPGQRLMEADLTRALKVSRGPVREALKRLAAERVIVLTRHRGAHVRALTRHEVDDLMEVIEVLMGTAARLAAKHIDEDDNRARFVRAFERLMAHRRVGDSFAFMEDRDRFYGAMTAVGGNRELTHLLPATHVRLIRLQCLPYLEQVEREQQFREYEAIGEAILAGDPRRAERYTRMHMRRNRKVYLSLPDAAFAVPADE